jgi:hypothetical protein
MIKIKTHHSCEYIDTLLNHVKFYVHYSFSSVTIFINNCYMFFHNMMNMLNFFNAMHSKKKNQIFSNFKLPV